MYLTTILTLIAAASASASPNSYSAGGPSAGTEPYLGSYYVEDACQYQLCGPEYVHEFASGRPVPESCSGECDALARGLANSKFKREFMWGKCADMCKEEYVEVAGVNNGQEEK